MCDKKERIVDLHMHVVPGVDDGSESIEESLEMLRRSAKQGVTDVFCTSHNGYADRYAEDYFKAFIQLKVAVKNAGIDVNLYKGCEVLCMEDKMDDILRGLESGAFSTLGNSKCVLTEFYPEVYVEEGLSIVQTLKKAGYTPIIAHMERNKNIAGFMVNTLVENGAYIQINAHSLGLGADISVKLRARELLDGGKVHFIGSDSHGVFYRPPRLEEGISYIKERFAPFVARQILFDNAKMIFNENK